MNWPYHCLLQCVLAAMSAEQLKVANITFERILDEEKELDKARKTLVSPIDFFQNFMLKLLKFVSWRCFPFFFVLPKQPGNDNIWTRLCFNFFSLPACLPKNT